MTNSITWKALAAIAAALIACTLGVLAFAPKSAYAAQQTDALAAAKIADTSPAAQAAPAMKASAKKTVYVRTALGGVKYKYNKYGLITKIVQPNSRWTLKYSGKKLVKATHTMNGYNDIKKVVKYDAKGRVKKIVSESGMQVDLYNNTETYYYNSKNRVTKKVTANAISGTKSTTKYAYNAAGQVRKIVMPDATDILKYDSKGTKTKWTRKFPAGSSMSNRYYTYKNTYNKAGRLVQTSTTEAGDKYSYDQKISYAKKSVPKKYASAVAEQQKALRQTIPYSLISLLG